MTFDLPNVYKKHLCCSVFKICYHFFVNECLNTWKIIICTHFPTAFFSVDLRWINLFSFIFYYNCIKDNLSVYCCWIGAKIAKSRYVLCISFSCFFFTIQPVYLLFGLKPSWRTTLHILEPLKPFLKHNWITVLMKHNWLKLGITT